MAEVLHVADEVTAVRTLATPSAVLDPATAAAVDEAVAAATARARREGELAGRQQAAGEVEQAAGGVRASLDRLTQELAEQRAIATAVNLEVAAELAQAVLGRTPPDDALLVLDRIRAAVDLLDADRLAVRLHPDDHAALRDHVTDARLDLVADPTMARGDAQLGTPVAGAELTRHALLQAALRVAEERAS